MMKANSNVTPTPVDRLATSEEIRAAVSLCTDDADEEYATANVWEIAADFGGYVRIPSRQVETLRLIEELLEESDQGSN
jgi:hypothetical protein